MDFSGRGLLYPALAHVVEQYGSLFLSDTSFRGLLQIMQLTGACVRVLGFPISTKPGFSLACVLVSSPDPSSRMPDSDQDDVLSIPS